jgi:hypothetical protein
VLLGVDVGNLTLCFAADAATLEGAFHVFLGLDQVGNTKRTLSL